MTGEQLRNLRHKAGWTQQQLAERLLHRPDYTIISKMENGKRRISLAEEYAIREILSNALTSPEE